MTPVIRKGKDAIASARQGAFIGVKAGDSIIIAPVEELDEVISIDQHTFWRDSGGSPSFPCILKKCPGCERGNGARFRGFLQVLTREGEVKVWSFPISVYHKLREIEEGIGSIKGMAISVRAKKKGQFTDYAVVATGKRVKIAPDIELLDVVPLLGPTTRDGIIELLDAAAAEDDAGDDDDEDVKPVKKGKPVDAKKPAKPAAPAKKSVVTEEPTEVVEEDDPDSEIPAAATEEVIEEVAAESDEEEWG
jgi:hypothetical protein